MTRDRKHTRLAVYLVGYKDDNILLGKRQNTGHMDGYWSLVAGHINERESATDAIFRECLEECDLKISHDELKCAGVMHHKSGEFDYVSFIYSLDLKGKTIRNCETDKCEELKFHPVDNLPKPIAPYVHFIIEKTLSFKTPWIAEYGWDDILL